MDIPDELKADSHISFKVFLVRKFAYALIGLLKILNYLYDGSRCTI